MPSNVVCPECKTEIDLSKGMSIYGHAVSCFHLPGQGPKRDLDTINSERRRSPEHVRRATILLKSSMEIEK